jgi:hypothetical protein
MPRTAACGGAPRSSAGAKFLVFVAALFALPLLVMLVRSSAVLPPQAAMVDGVPRLSHDAPPPVLLSPPRIEMRRVELRDRVGEKLLDGSRRVLELQNRATAIRNQQLRWDEQRDAVDTLRQRLGQARVVAEEEGRWPVRAAGHIFGRTDILSAIDRTERYLYRYRGVSPALSSAAALTSAAIADANTQLDAIRRIQDDLPLGGESRDETAREFSKLSARFDAIANDPRVYTPLPEVAPFDLDAPQ